MKLPFVSRKTYEKNDKRLRDIINVYRELIDIKEDHINKLKEKNKNISLELEDRDNYIQVLEQENKLYSKTVKELKEELEKKENIILDFKKVFNQQNIELFCNNESKRQIRKLSEDIMNNPKLTKLDIAKYLRDISFYVGGGCNKQFILTNDKGE